MTPATSKILAALELKGLSPVQNGHGWKARCPGHDDDKPSLSISDAENGGCVLKCFAGCSNLKIVAAIGKRLRDLMPDGDAPTSSRPASTPPPPPRETKPRTVYNTSADALAAAERSVGCKVSRCWTYHNEHSTPVGMALRFDTPKGKDVRPLARVADGWIIGAMPAPRPLYRLPEVLKADPATAIVVVEGEKSADAAARLGYVATTSAGGSQAAGKSDWTPLRDRDVAILPDRDDAGERYAADVARLARAAGARSVRIVRLSDCWPDLSAGGDVADLADAAAGDVAALEKIRVTVDGLIQATPAIEADPAAAAEPVDVHVEREPFPLDALPFPMRSIVKAVSKCTQTAPEMAGLAALVTAAGSIGNQAIVRYKKGFDQPSVVWGANISKSGTNKSAPQALVTTPLDARAERKGDEHASLMQTYVADVAEHKAKVTAWKDGGCKGPMPTAPPAPIQERVTTDDFTFERLVTLSAENPRGLAIIVDELGSWALAMNQQRGGKGADLPGFLTAYDARPRTRDRQKPNGEQAHTCVRVPRFALSILGTIQPRVFARLFGQQERDAGLLARLLVIDPPEAYPDLSDDELDEATASAWADTLENLLTFNLPADGKLKPLVVHLSADAKGAFRTWHNDVQAEMRRGIPDDDLRAYYGKLKGVCLRIALVFHCVECTARGDDPAQTPISLDTMQRAIRVTEWFRRTAVRVYDRLSESETDRDRRELVEYIHNRGGSISASELRSGSTKYRRKYPGVEQAEAALRALATAGWGTLGPPEKGPKGAPKAPRFTLTAK